MTTKTYDVHRSMHGDGKDYEPGDTRELDEADARALVDMGALSLKGDAPFVRPDPVRHTFGAHPSEVNDGGYTTAAGEPVAINRPAAPKAKLKA